MCGWGGGGGEGKWGAGWRCRALLPVRLARNPRSQTPHPAPPPHPPPRFYIDPLRECYEAFVIYNFFAFLVTYLEDEYGDVAAYFSVKEQVGLGGLRGSAGRQGWGGGD